MAKKYSTVYEVAARFQVSEGTIYRAVHDGAIPHVRILTLIRIPTWWVDEMDLSLRKNDYTGVDADSDAIEVVCLDNVVKGDE